MINKRKVTLFCSVKILHSVLLKWLVITDIALNSNLINTKVSIIWQQI